jgi:N-acyl-D-amino-acid deacylase
VQNLPWQESPVIAGSAHHHMISRLSRRKFLRDAALGIVAASAFPIRAANKEPLAALAKAFDPVVEKFMHERGVPGGALAVVKDRKLVYARGYGWADRDKKIAAQPDTLFRIASVSKPFTAVAVFKLIEQGRLSLDAKAVELTGIEPLLANGAKRDARLDRITVRQLLQHTGGWDRDRSGDPMFKAVPIATLVGEPPPARPQAVIRYMLGRSLDFDPGTRYTYSNFGFCLLGRIIEKISGESYESFVRENVLKTAGITRIKIGSTREQAEGESRYYTVDTKEAANVFPDGPRKVPWPYGGFHLEAMDAHGGWIASVSDLARFAAAMDDPEHSPLLKPESWKEMFAPPPAPVSRREDGVLNSVYYGCGWQVRPLKKKGAANFWHLGSLPGTASMLVRRGDGISYAVLFNQRSENLKLGDSAIDPALYAAADSVKRWPQDNLFPKWK